jgi:hypothetical protein
VHGPEFNSQYCQRGGEGEERGGEKVREKKGGEGRGRGGEKTGAEGR